MSHMNFLGENETGITHRLSFFPAITEAIEHILSQKTKTKNDIFF